MNAQDYIQSLSATLFWDVDPASVDPFIHKRFVICRVMDRGTREEVKVTCELFTLLQKLMGLDCLKDLAVFKRT